MDEIIGVFSDGSTGETIERPLTEEELVSYNLVIEESIRNEEQAQKKLDDIKSARRKFAKLGLTEDEINAIIGGV